MTFFEFLSLNEDIMKFKTASVRDEEGELSVYVNRVTVDRIAIFLGKRKVKFFKISVDIGSFALKIKSPMKFEDLKKMIADFEKEHNRIF